MFRWFKKVFQFINKQKKLLTWLVVLTILFFSLRFPWNNLLEETARSFQKKSPPSLQTDFDKLRLTFFPLGVEFKNLSVNYKRKSSLLDSFRVSMILSKWLAFKKAWRVKAVKDNSSLFVDFWKTEKTLEDDPENRSVTIYFVKGHSPLLDLKDLSSLFSNIKMSGLLKTHFDYEGSLTMAEEVKAFLNLKGEDIRLSSAEIQTPLGALNFPPIRWKEGEIISQLKEGELVFKTFRLGAPTDNLIVQMKGSSSVGFSYGRFRLNSYNVQLQIDVDKNMEMSWIDLMLAGYKEDKGSFYRYRLRLTGKGYQIPDMEKLSEF